LSIINDLNNEALGNPYSIQLDIPDATYNGSYVENNDNDN